MKCPTRRRFTQRVEYTFNSFAGDSISKGKPSFQVDSKFTGDDFVRGGSSIGAQVENVDSSDSEEEEENGDVGFTFLKQVTKLSVFGNLPEKGGN